MTPAQAKRTFADLMKKSRSPQGLTERDRVQLSQARQLLRRGARPAMNARKRYPSHTYRPPQEFHGTTHRGYSIQFNAMRNEYWIEKDGAFIAYAQTISDAKKKIDSIFGDNPKLKPITRKTWIDQRAKELGLSVEISHPGDGSTRFHFHKGGRHIATAKGAKAAEKFIREYVRETPGPNPHRKAKQNPTGKLQRIGRAVEVRYQRTIGSKPGFYKHEIRSHAGVYTIPPGWVYVGSKSILITEGKPRV